MADSAVRRMPYSETMSWIVLFAFVAILLALASAGRAMLRGGSRDGQAKPRRMLQALAWRVGLSVALFVFILVSYQLGWIEPTGLPLRR